MSGRNPILLGTATPVPIEERWNPKRAERWLRQQVRKQRECARHLHENRDDYASSEEEFQLGLTQGAGFVEEDVAEIIADIKKGGEE